MEVAWFLFFFCSSSESVIDIYLCVCFKYVQTPTCPSPLLVFLVLLFSFLHVTSPAAPQSISTLYIYTQPLILLIHCCRWSQCLCLDPPTPPLSLNPSLPVLISASLCLERVHDSRFYQCYGLKLAHVPPTPYTHIPCNSPPNTHTHTSTLLPFYCPWSQCPCHMYCPWSQCFCLAWNTHTFLKQNCLPSLLPSLPQEMSAFPTVVLFFGSFSFPHKWVVVGHCFTIVAEWDDQRWWKVFAKHKHTHAGLHFNLTGKTTVIRISNWACFTVRICFVLFFPSSFLWWLGLYNGHRAIYCNI